jgi:hypothetical protein
MPATPELYQEVFQKITAVTRASGLSKHPRRRLAWVVTGIIGARSCGGAAIARELYALGVTRASGPDSVARTVRRILGDRRLRPETCYEPVLRDAIDWFSPLWDQRSVVLIVDESSQDERVHLFRVSLAYWGGALPLVWALWPQNERQAPGTYWQQVDRVLARVAALLPRGLDVVVVADRAYDIPPFIDRIAAYGWHWLVRCKAKGTVRYRVGDGREAPLSERIAREVGTPGRRWKARVQVFKEAGWREASVVAVWAPQAEEPLVTLSDLPPRWDVHAAYDSRFWTEPGFRNDKSQGWQWEDNRVTGIERQNVLLTAMAWATLLVLCLGRAEAQDRLDAQLPRAQKRLARGRSPAKPQPARESLFTLGWHVAHRWLYHNARGHLRWLLDAISLLSWSNRWFQSQARLFIFFQTVRL